MARRRNRVPRRRKRRNRRRGVAGIILYRLLCVALVLAAGALAISIFFKVQHVEVKGDTRYAAADIQKTLDIQVGDSLFFINKSGSIKKLFAAYPYLDEVQIKRELPDTLIVTVSESTAAAAVQSGEQYYLMDKNGKLLESVKADGIGTLPHVSGITIKDGAVGQILSKEDNEKYKQLCTLLQALTDGGVMKDIHFINLNRSYDVRIGYMKRFDVRLGTLDNLAKKIRFLKTIVSDSLSPSEIGVIDLSDVKSAHFRPATAEQVEASATADGTEQTTITAPTTDTQQADGAQQETENENTAQEETPQEDTGDQQEAEQDTEGQQEAGQDTEGQQAAEQDTGEETTDGEQTTDNEQADGEDGGDQAAPAQEQEKPAEEGAA